MSEKEMKGSINQKKLLMIMMISIIIVLLLFLSMNTPQIIWKQYPYSSPDSSISFPTDEGSHSLGNEWWYFNFNGIDKNGNDYAMELNYDIRGSFPGGGERELCFIDIGNEKYYSNIKQGVFNTQTDSLNLSFRGSNIRDEWKQVENRPFEYSLTATTLFENGNDEVMFNITLYIIALKPPMTSTNISSPGIQSYYYSFPRLDVRGTAKLGDVELVLEGIGWMDHQYFQSGAVTGISGWEWFSVNLDSGTDLMIYQLFDYSGNITQKAIFINYPDGTYEMTSKVDISYIDYWSPDPDDNLKFSSGWQIRSSLQDINLTIQPKLQSQLLRTTFWEGTCTINSTINSVSSSGDGFAELKTRHNV